MYMPCSNKKVLDKSLTLKQCDAFIFDLEDAVSKDLKHIARSNICEFLTANRANEKKSFVNQFVTVRINGLDSEFFQNDLDELTKLNALPNGIILPKAENVVDIQRLKKIFPTCEIWSMIETPKGVLNAHELVRESETLVLGLEDLSKELKCSKANKRSALMTSMQLSILAARSYNRSILDG